MTANAVASYSNVFEWVQTSADSLFTLQDNKHGDSFYFLIILVIQISVSPGDSPFPFWEGDCLSTWYCFGVLFFLLWVLLGFFKAHIWFYIWFATGNVHNGLQAGLVPSAEQIGAITTVNALIFWFSCFQSESWYTVLRVFSAANRKVIK